VVFSGKNSERKRKRRSIPIEVLSDREEEYTNSSISSYAFIDEDEATGSYSEFFLQRPIAMEEHVIEEPEESIEIEERTDEDENLSIVIRMASNYKPLEHIHGDTYSAFFPRTRLGEFFDDFNNMFMDFQRFTRNMGIFESNLRDNFNRFSSTSGGQSSCPRSRFRTIPIHDEEENEASNI
jgi:hypothetical protein